MRKAKVSSTLSGTNFMPTKPIPEDIRTRPIKLTDNARVVLQKRYVRRGEDGKPAETEQEMFWRVAYHVALAEAEFDEDVEKYARLFYELLTNLEFFPNSPTFTGAGTPLGQLAACFVLAIDDDMGRTESGIFQTLRDAALIQQTGGGNGFAFSRLRPKGAIVKSSRGEATGPVGFLRVYDQAFGEIAQGGCLLPDTLVFTDQGLLRLDEIVRHTERGWQSHHLTVATDEGVRRSTNAYNNGVVPVLKIITDAGIELTGTPNHKVKTNRGWQQFDQLEQSDTILVQLRGFIHANPEQTLKTDQGATLFNAETAYQLGYFMGGGSLDPQTRQLFSKNALTDAQGCALTAIPRIVRQSPVHVIKAFLKGLHKAAANSSVYAQVVLQSPQLAQEVAVLLIGLGFPAFVVPQPEGVLVSLEAPVLEQVGLPTATKTSYVGRERYWPTPFGDADLADFDGRFVWEVKVASVAPAGESLTLDIEVEDNHTYLANGLVTHNSRRGANMAVLKVSHPDIRDFVTCKSNESQITNFNISVGMTDEFMRAVEGDEDFQLVNPVDGNVWETVRARDLFDLIVQQAHHNGEPGVLFLDAANRANPVPHLYELESTNPCGEQYLGPFENCCLGSINLAELNIIDGKPDWDHFQRMIETATRFLDDVVSANSYVPAVPQLAQAAHRVRRIGLGVMGLGDLMYKIGVRYGSDEGQEFAGQISEFLRYYAMKTSIDLAKERGAFPAIEGSLYDPENLKWQPPTPLKPYTRDWDRPSLDWEKIVNRIKKHGIRNGAQCTVAPTGTIATVSGCEAYGCEPVFALAYIRHVNDKGQDLQLQYTSPLLQKALEKAGLNSDQIKHIVEQVNHDGTCQNISDLPESIRHTFVVSSDITAEEHIYMQAAMQRFIDNAISKTCNFPAGATAEDVKQAYILGWKLGCKGLTVYVTGSRDKVVLETHATAKAKEGKPDEAQPAVVQAAPEIAVTTAQVTVEPKHDGAAHMPRLYPTENNKRERPRRLVGQTFRVGTPLGATYVTVNENGDGKGQPFEVFIHTAKAGSETAAIAEAIGRLISLVLRMKSPLEPRMRLKEIIDQLEGIGGGRATGFGPARVRSLPDGVSQALQEYVEVTDSVEVEVVPSTLARLDQPAAHTHDNGASASATPHVAEAKTPVKAGIIVGDLCPECGEASVVNEEGCRKCYSCGYSEC
ncbi:MAG: adenosylcobalamin-dependent ribonucleoside-diphosphate reductase [Anaerolineae bacterium]|nr:adenosylcobalamin-dependent ribonucleoside-diphosphate reductase [Anaerolineae bacterium]